MSYRPAESGLLKRSSEWEKLRMLVERVKGAGLSSLDEQQLWELPSLYRKTLSDLSLLRTRADQPALIQELEQLCNSAHALIYAGTMRKKSIGLLKYLSQEMPQTVRRRSGYVLAAAIITVFFTIIGYLHCSMNPRIAETMLGPRMLGSIHASLATARDPSDLGLAARIEEQDRTSAWLQITLNNWGVSIRAFVFGIAAALPTQIILALNGYMLGAVAYVYLHTNPGIQVNLPLYFFAGIAPHGSIEIPAICVAGGAGMLLGFSWLFPGQRPRGQALREAVPDAMCLLWTCIATLTVAGAIEGFVTPMRPPAGFDQDSWFWLKIGMGCIVFSLWFCWLYFGGRVRKKGPIAKGNIRVA